MPNPLSYASTPGAGRCTSVMVPSFGPGVVVILRIGFQASGVTNRSGSGLSLLRLFSS